MGLKKTEKTPTRWHTNFPLRELAPLKIKKEETFLDMGSGAGFHVAGASLKGANAIGVDISTGNVLLGRKLAAYIAGAGEKGERILSRLMSPGGARKMRVHVLRERYGRAVSLLKSPAARASELKHYRERVPSPEGRAVLKHFETMEKVLKGKAPAAGAGFILAGGQRLPLKENSIDKILSLAAIHHLSPKGRENALREILRVAKPGARIRLRSDPYLVGGEKLTASEHFARVAKESGAKVSYRLRKGRPTTFVLVSKA